MEAIAVGDNRRHFLGVGRVDEVDLGELAQGGEVLEEVLVAQVLDVGEVVIHVAIRREEGRGGEDVSDLDFGDF